MSIVWKSSEILKVFGTTIREGVYVRTVNLKVLTQ